MRRRETYSIRKTVDRTSSRYSRDSGLEDEYDQTTSFLSRGSNTTNQLENTVNNAVERQSSDSEAYEVFETRTSGSSREIHCPNRCVHGSEIQSAHLVTNDMELLYDPSTLRHLRRVFKLIIAWNHLLANQITFEFHSQ